MNNTLFQLAPSQLICSLYGLGSWRTRGCGSAETSSDTAKLSPPPKRSALKHGVAVSLSYYPAPADFTGLLWAVGLARPGRAKRINEGGVSDASNMPSYPINPGGRTNHRWLRATTCAVRTLTMRECGKEAEMRKRNGNFNVLLDRFNTLNSQVGGYVGRVPAPFCLLSRDLTPPPVLAASSQSPTTICRALRPGLAIQLTIFQP
ncbi:hypothetical protein P152DRAFT_24638 [Eremomyces bilateralis CBS 781.70]|uniref:Uncharacterized protein n=1 Tax=Eremomyces bilateralis CBS 781.70 TaxID=1392243 RepID=A0A6G1GI99_9PEZI|nr:uncharacterized protein P152DRAFT_24638 [Eremomyces bilateralis CBS 781.70]KAF1817609.1 hypothetical protein P152DRAFT_24638 [Eremomyces bilateralis CBS 781.70]